MSIKRQWLLALLFIATVSVLVNAIVLSGLTDRYFKNYISQDYTDNLDQIVAYAKKGLLESDVSLRQMAIELETHLDDPIIGIKLYDKKGTLLIDVQLSDEMGNRKSHGMMDRMMDSQSAETDDVSIMDNGTEIGRLLIARYTSVEESIVPKLFQSSLRLNSLISIGVVGIIALLMGLLISKKMSNALVEVSNTAQQLDLGETQNFNYSSVREIRMIQQSLATLSNKLKLKQKSRKKLVDEMVHQTRTPLTILKTHLEGIEDGVIQMNKEEIGIFSSQIESLTSIIANMSQMIDGEQVNKPLTMCDVDINSLIKQIVDGLKAQFGKKAIELKILSTQKVVIHTDRHLLSQAIYNMVTNAYKFTPENGSVHINWSVLEKSVRIEIRDTGIGIDKTMQVQIFDAYFQIPSTYQLEGQGIGLFVAKENIELLGGQISLESELGKGSRFMIELPFDPNSL